MSFGGTEDPRLLSPLPVSRPVQFRAPPPTAEAGDISMTLLSEPSLDDAHFTSSQDEESASTLHDFPYNAGGVQEGDEVDSGRACSPTSEWRRARAMFFFTSYGCRADDAQAVYAGIKRRIHDISARARVHAFAEIVLVQRRRRRQRSEFSALLNPKKGKLQRWWEKVTSNQERVASARLVSNDDDELRSKPNSVLTFLSGLSGRSTRMDHDEDDGEDPQADNEELINIFNGVIQVVPIHTMKQCSLRRNAPISCLIPLQNHRMFIPLFILFHAVIGMAFPLVIQFVPGTEWYTVITNVMWAVCAVQVFSLILWFMHLSRPITRMLLFSIEWWTLIFWLTLGSYCRATAALTSLNARELMIADVVSFTAIQLGLLLLDGYSPIQRKWKGIAYAANFVLHVYTYFRWWYDVFSTDRLSEQMVPWFRGEVPMPVLAQSAAFAVAAYHLRLAIRTLKKRLDLAIVDFPVNVVPHQQRQDVPVSSSLRDAPPSSRSARTSDLVTEQFRRDAMQDGEQEAVSSSPRAEINGEAQQQGQGAEGAEEEEARNNNYEDDEADDDDEDEMWRRHDNSAGAFVQMHADVAASVQNFGRVSAGDFHIQRMRRRSTARGSLDASTVRPTRPGAAMITLHVDGSLPVPADADDEAMESALREAVQPADLDSCLTEVTNTFAPDRRTFLPAAYMLNYSPKPLVPSQSLFRLMSLWWWPFTILVISVTSAVALSAILNDRLSEEELLPAQFMVRVPSIVLILGHLLCGVSVALVREAVFTLDFWAVMVTFGLQTIASAYYYYHIGTLPLVIIHSVLLVLVGMFFALFDCIAVPSFTTRIKGIFGVLLAVYTLFDLSAPVSHRNVEVLHRTIDLRFTVVSPQSLTELSGLALLLLYMKVAARTLVMGSSLVFFQFGAIEELPPPLPVVVGPSSSSTSSTGSSSRDSSPRSRTDEMEQHLSQEKQQRQRKKEAAPVLSSYALDSSRRERGSELSTNLRQ